MIPLVVRSHGAATSAIAPRLSAGDRERLARLSGEAAAAFLAGREALFAALDGIRDARDARDAPAHAATGPAAGIDAACPECGRSHGRPRVTGRDGIHLALTHAGGFAFAVAAAAPLGIDAEPLDTDAARAEAAASLIPRNGTPSGPGSALARWTAVEAVLKADGRGLRVNPSAVRLGGRSATLDGMRYRLQSRRSHGCLVTVALAASGRPGHDQRVSEGSGV